MLLSYQLVLKSCIVLSFLFSLKKIILIKCPIEFSVQILFIKITGEKSSDLIEIESQINKAYINQASHNWNIKLNTYNVKEEKFNLTHSFRRFSIWSANSKTKTSLQMGVGEQRQFLAVHGCQEADQGTKAKEQAGIVCSTWTHASMDHQDNPRNTLY